MSPGDCPGREMPPVLEPLPIDYLRPKVEAACRETVPISIVAPPGSGKSTRVPGWFLEEGTVVVLQPRRIAAIRLAVRVAEERGVKVGEEVGYWVRHERRVGPKTRMVFMTFGVFLRQLLSGRSRGSEWGTVVFDEFHERSWEADFALAHLSVLKQQGQYTGRIVAMSATMDTSLLQNVMGNWQHFTAEGSLHPVEVEHARGAPDDPVGGALEAWLQLRDRGGDILVFLPGEGEIRRMIRIAEERRVDRGWEFLPLFGQLSLSEQEKVFRKGDHPRVIVSTNIAETSLTIPGIRGVIDSGLARVKRFDGRRLVDSLLVERVSKASATQRSGRAGREGPGWCFRLWSAQEHEHLSAYLEPEVFRVDLSKADLLALSAGYADLMKVPWPEPPPPEKAAAARGLLKAMGALGDDRRLTARGRVMVSLPVHPRLAAVLLAAGENGVLGRALDWVTLLEEDVRPGRIRSVKEILGDCLDLEPELLALEGREGDPARVFGRGLARRLQLGRLQLAKVMDFADDLREPWDEGTGARLCRSIVAGFPDRVGMIRNRGTQVTELTSGLKGRIRRESSWSGGDFLLASSVDEVRTRQGMQLLLGGLSRVEEHWLREDFPAFWKQKEEVCFDSATAKVCRRREESFGELILRSTVDFEIDDSTRARVFATEIESGRLELRNWTEAVDHWVRRVRFLAERMPEAELDPIEGEARRVLLEEICRGKQTGREVRTAEVLPVLETWLSNEQRLLLESAVPESLELSGRRRPFRIHYREDGEASVSLTVQELYGVDRPITIAGGRYALIVEILAPNRRPVQVTRDPGKFWTDSYPEVRKQLRGRYPKHEWR